MPEEFIRKIPPHIDFYGEARLLKRFTILFTFEKYPLHMKQSR